MNDSEARNDEGNAYDLLPYMNYAYNQTHIARLFLLGTLWGLDPVDFRRARVLELGCASGGNILPMADQYPESRFLGIELSRRQIEDASAFAAEIGVANLELRAQSILDFDPPDAPFDYIICHGFFSWVGAEIRAKMLRILRDHLAPRGLALVSYNTYPGWGGPERLRDMMLDHTAAERDPLARVADARRLLETILDAQGESSGYYRKMIEAELQTMRTESERYVFHEYLEDENYPIFFRDFAALAGAHGLAYVTDADPGIGHLGNYAPKVRPFLAAVADRLRREQYLDYMQNRRFRSSVLARSGAAIRAPEAGSVAPFWLSWEARLERPPAQPAERLSLPLTFLCANGQRASLSDPAGAALALALHEARGEPRSVGEIVQRAKARFGLAEAEPELARRLCEFALPMFLSRAMNLLADPGRQVTAVSARPVALPIARAQARRTERVTNCLHETVALEATTRALLPRLDGKADHAALARHLAAPDAFFGTAPDVEQARQRIAKLTATELSALVGGALAQLAQNALLIG